MLIRRACGVGLGDPAKESYLRKHFYGGLMHQENVSDFQKATLQSSVFPQPILSFADRVERISLQGFTVV